MRQQALNTVAVEGPCGFRIAKEEAGRKIDAIVALSMACVAACDTTARVQDLLTMSIFWDRVTEQPPPGRPRQTGHPGSTTGTGSDTTILVRVRAPRSIGLVLSRHR